MTDQQPKSWNNLRGPGFFSLPAVLFWALVLVYAGYGFTLPVFSTGDGAGHVYWGDVLAKHLLGTGDYPEFEIQQYLPPYALTSYYLAFTTTFLPGAMAGKTLVALCIVVLCTGVRRLSLAVSESSGWAALIIVPFSFHNLLFAGFYNFCLGAGLVAWTAAFWITNCRRMTGRRAAVFPVLVAGLYLAHPFALAVGLLFCGLHLAVHLLRSVVSAQGAAGNRLKKSLQENRWAILGVLVGTPLAWYVTTFIWPQDEMPAVITWTRLSAAAVSLWEMDGLLAHSSEIGRISRLLLLAAALLLGAAGVLWPVRRRRSWDAGFLFAFAILMFFLYAWAPDGMTTAVLVAQRMMVFFVMFAVASAARIRLSPRAGAIFGTGVIALTLLAFLGDVGIHRAVAEKNRVLIEAPALKPGAHGVVVTNGWEGASSAGAGYWPCLWSPAHYFQRSRATMLNAPWHYERYSILRIREWREYWGFEGTRMKMKLRDGLDDPENALLPARLDFLIRADCSGREPGDDTVSRLVEHYGLVRMPWSTPAYSFYVHPEWEFETSTAQLQLHGE